jgi:hypothetical protein
LDVEDKNKEMETKEEMTKGSIEWHKLTKKHKVIEKPSHFETGSGKLITWTSRDSGKAQRSLKKMAKKRR